MWSALEQLKYVQVSVTFPCSDRCGLNFSGRSYQQLGQGPVERLALRWDSMGYENGPWNRTSGWGFQLLRQAVYLPVLTGIVCTWVVEVAWGLGQGTTVGLILILEGEGLGNGSEKQNWTWGSRSTGRQESNLLWLTWIYQFCLTQEIYLRYCIWDYSFICFTACSLLVCWKVNNFVYY